MGSVLERPSEQSEEEKTFASQPRFSIMYLLFLKRKVGFLDIKKLLGLTPGNLDHHIKKLEEIGLVKSHRVLSWRPLVMIEITPRGSGVFREYIVKLKTLLENIPDTLLENGML